MDYKKKSLNKLSNDSSYEEIDTRLASGWYVDSVDNNKKKKYRTKKVAFKISKKIVNIGLKIRVIINKDKKKIELSETL